MSDRIALFRTTGISVDVTHAALPDLNSDREPVLSFIPFREIQIPTSHALRSQTSSHPVYTNNMVYWAVHGQETPLDARSSVISVWRMDRHFVVAGVDRAGGRTKHRRTEPTERGSTTIEAETWWGCVAPGSPEYRPAVVVDGKILTVCCANKNTGRLMVSQKTTDGSWAEVFDQPKDNGTWYPSTMPLDREVSDAEGRSLVMISGPSVHPSLQYTYRFVSEGINECPIRIDMMKNSDLLNLRNDKAPCWHRTTFPAYLPRDDHAYIITHAENGLSHKLFFFEFGPSTTYIMVRWFHLLKDGFIDRSRHEWHGERNKFGPDGYYAVSNNGMHLEIAKGAPGTGDTPYCDSSSRQLKAFTWTAAGTDGTEFKNLLLMWHSDQGWAAIMGKLDPDGGIPPDWQWKNVKVWHHNGSAPAYSYDLQGVLVPNDFV